MTGQEILLVIYGALALPGFFILRFIIKDIWGEVIKKIFRDGYWILKHDVGEIFNPLNKNRYPYSVSQLMSRIEKLEELTKPKPESPEKED